jgi:hypothetical protein
MIQPTYPLDPLMMNNAYPSRITATAGTRLVGINRKVQSLSSFPLGLYQINVSVLLGDWFSLSAIDQDSALLPILCSCGPFSFPLWLIVLSDQLWIIGLVSRYLTNYLIYSIGTSIGGINPFNIWYSTNPMGSLPIRYSPVRHVQIQVFGIRLACVKSLDSIHSKLSLNFYLLF